MDFNWLDPENFEYVRYVDYILAKSKQWEQIIKYWDAYIAIKTNDGRAYAQRGGTYSHKGDIKLLREFNPQVQALRLNSRLSSNNISALVVTMVVLSRCLQ